MKKDGSGVLNPVAELIDRGVLPVAHGGLETLGVPPSVVGDWDRIEGMLLGLAIGDALGNSTESRLPASRQEQYGEIRDYLPNRHAENRRVGLPSDDTQLAYWTLECLCEDGGVVPEHLARAFSSRRIFGVGATVRSFVRGYREEGKPWYEAAPHSAGNGAVMRIAPVLLPHVRNPSTRLWEDAILAGAVTHNDPSSIGACVGVIGILWSLLAMKKAPTPTWWIDEYCRRARPVEGDVALKPRHANFVFGGPVWGLVQTEVRKALEEQKSVRDACDYWYSGAFLLETIPSVIFILARHGDDPEQAIVRAVNDTKDNDTIGAIVGAAVGALHGRTGLPQRWIDGLIGRTREDDDGRVFELIERARRKWFED